MKSPKETENIDIFLTPPTDFHSKMSVASIYCSYKNKLLLVKRHPEKPQGGTWGVPAGKIEEGEDPRSAAIRETFEEVGLKAQNPEKITVLYVRWHHHLDFIFHMFHQEFKELPDMQIAKMEHTEARWATKEEAEKLPLIVGGFTALECFEEFKKLSSQKQVFKLD